MRQIITLDALVVLDAIDRRGSFAAAAEDLHRVPSALTYTVQKLEQDFAVSLFRREGRRSVLTAAGRELLLEGRKILEAVNTLTESTKRIARGWEPRLNLAIDTLLPLERVFPVISEFYQLHPEVEFNIAEEVLAGSWDALLTGQAELVIGNPDLLPDKRGISQEPLMSLEMVAVAAPGHPAASISGAISEIQLDRFRTVVAGDSALNLAHQTRGLSNAHPVLRVPGMDAKIAAYRQGLGIGSAPRFRVAELLARGELVELQLERPVASTSLAVGWLAGYQGKALHWLVDALLSHFADHSAA